jgi:hypothetical protein
MMPKTVKGWIALVLVLASFAFYLYDRADQKRRVLVGPVAEVPQQSGTNAKAFVVAGFQIEPVADYDIRAKVLSAERYRMGREAELSPVDFALGWGPMSDNQITDQLDISQGNRWYQYRWRGAPPLEPSLIVRTSANTHLIPADDDVKSQLLGVKRGEVVRLKGYLVNVKHADGWAWRSSLSRDDSGAGACELLWVREVSVE